jgi:uncharacterized protein
MKQVILIHGWNTREEYYDPDKPTASNDHWFPWLTKELMIRDIHTIALEMPQGYYPEYSKWKKGLERYDIDEDTTLVGHSCGGGFLVRWLTEENVNVGKVILVAPWMGIDFGAGPFDESFFDFKINPDIQRKTKSLTIIYSTDDFPAVVESVDILRHQLNDVEYKEFVDKGHFTRTDLQGESFPEILNILGVQK